MNDSDALAQKAKGKLQKAKGELQQETGHGVKGGVAKAKGEVNDKMADLKLKANREERQAEFDETEL
jgi:hypothetical protein